MFNVAAEGLIQVLGCNLDVRLDFVLRFLKGMDPLGPLNGKQEQSDRKHVKMK